MLVSHRKGVYMRYWSLLIAVFISCLHAQEAKWENASGQKIYISHDRIVLDREGIFFIDEHGDFCPASLISFDQGGVFVVASSLCDFCYFPDGRHASSCIYADLPRR